MNPVHLLSARCRRRPWAPLALLAALLGAAPVAQAQTPAVLATSPARNAKTAPRNSSVMLVYNQTVVTLPGTVRVFSAQAGGQKAGTIAPAIGIVPTFDPAVDFKPGEVVSVSALSSVLGAFNGLSAIPYVYQFTTAASVAPAVFNVGADVATTNPTGVTPADVDGDGDLDLLVGNNTNPATVTVMRNDGAGSFVVASAVNVAKYPLTIVAADVDGDGDLDLVTSSWPDNVVSVRFNQGGAQGGTAGNYAGGADYGVGTAPFAVAVGDVDGDGDLDFAAANYSNASVSVRLNNGAGSYSGSATVSVGSHPQGVTLADMNNDGRLDLITTNQFPSEAVSIRFGDGAGNFAGGSEASLGGDRGNSVTTADLNGDGSLDIISANVFGTTTLLFNNGTGGIGSTSVLGLSTDYATTGDVDGDGDLDLITNGSGLQVSFNNGAGVFSGPQSFTGGGGQSGVAVGDVDGDGDLDLIAANNGANSVSVRLNQAAVPTLTSLSPTSGLVGTSVTLTGTNLTGATGVSFNGTSALTFSVTNATTATTTVPAGATSGNVTIATPGGISNGVAFTVINDLVVSTTQSVPAGTYRNVTVITGGRANLVGDVTVTGTFLVQAGGVVRTRSLNGCATITGPGSFVLAARAQLSICSPQGISASGPTGNVQVTGPRTFSPHAIYFYYGTGNQITGSGLPAQVFELDKFDTGTLSLSQAVAVREGVGLFGPAGNIDLAGQTLTLRSDADSTAFVYNGNAGAILGSTAVVQRYITPGTAPGLGYRHLSSPVQSSPVADLTTSGFTPVVNGAYNTVPNPIAVRPYPTVLGFDETRFSTSSDFSKGYFSPTSLAAPLVVGRGYSVYMSGGLTPDFVGTLTTGDVTMSGLTHTGNFNLGTQKSGWHLLGNPYPSPLDWDLISIPAGMSNSVSVYKSTGGANGLYLTRAGGTGSLPDGMIAMGQGIFVRMLSGPVSFTFPNAARPFDYANPAHYRMAPDSRPLVKLTLHAAGAPAEETDEATIYFQAGASAGLDARFDGEKPAHNVGVPTLVSLTAEGEELAVNGLPESALTAGLMVPLLVDVPTTGTYELAVGQALNLGGQDVALLDQLTGTRYDLSEQPVVRFTTQQAGEVRGRFALVIGPAEAAAPGLVLYPNPAHGTVRVSGIAAGETVRVFDGLGREVRSLEAPRGGAFLRLDGLPAGVYVVRAGARTQRLVVE